MLETLSKQEITIATAVGGIIFALTNNIPFLLLSAFVTWWSISKFNQISLKNVENREVERVDNEWNKLLEECLEHSSAGQAKLKPHEVTEKAQVLALMQRDRVSSVEIDERVFKSLENHIEFCVFSFGVRLKERRLVKIQQLVSHIERTAEELGHRSSKVENNGGATITILPTKEKMRKLNLAEREEQKALFEYVQNLPNISKVEAESVIKSSAGDHQLMADFIATNTLGERYIIQTKTVRESIPLAENRAKEQLIRYGAKLAGVHVMHQSGGRTKIVYVGKMPSTEEE